MVNESHKRELIRMAKEKYGNEISPICSKEKLEDGISSISIGKDIYCGLFFNDKSGSTHLVKIKVGEI